MKKTIIITPLIGLVLIFFIGYSTTYNSQKRPNDIPNPVQENKDSAQAKISLEISEENNPPTKNFILTGKNFKFMMDGQDSPTIIVKKGDKVRIDFKSIQGVHDWVINEFNAAIGRVREGDGGTSVEFVADKTGTFEYYCSVGSHRAMGMVGKLIVE